MTANDEGETILVRIPMTHRKRSGRKEIVLPEGTKIEQAPTEPPGPVVAALARAHKWQRTLDMGKATSLEQLSGRAGIDRAYVGRILRLTCLAPDIVEAILRGEEPDGLSLEKLRKNLPVRWDEQRKRRE